MVVSFADSVKGEDWGYLIAIYVLLILARALTLFVFYPLLYYTGESFTFKEYILTVWGGLRGALSVALCLVVGVDPDLKQRPKTLILFHTCGIAVLTLLLNGTTAPFIVNSIDLIQNIQVRKHFKSLFLKSVKKVG